MINPFVKFNTEFFKSGLGFPVKWYDKEGIIELDENRLVSITIDDIGCRNHYVGYWVEIINKHKGTIYKKFFRFEDHMEFKHRDSSKYYYTHIEDEDLKWYISKPTPYEPENMCKTISSFITKFI